MYLNQKAEDLISKYTKSLALCKISIGVYENGNKDTTMFDGGHQIDCSTSAIYEIGGVTAAFTASLMQKMILENIIHADDNVTDFFDDVPKDKVYPRIEQLASHGSGYPIMPFSFYFNAFLDGKKNINPYLYFSYKDMVSYLTKNEMNPEKIKCQLSHFGMGVLGCCLSAAAKTEFEPLMNDFVQKELKLANTTLDVDFRTMVIGHNNRGKKSAAWGYQSMTGALGLKSNVSDMLDFMRMNMNDEMPYFAECRKAHSTPVTGPATNFGYGWAINGNVVWLSGTTGGHRTFAGFDVEKKKAVCVMSNYVKDKGGVSVEQIGFALLG